MLMLSGKEWTNWKTEEEDEISKTFSYFIYRQWNLGWCRNQMRKDLQKKKHPTPCPGQKGKKKEGR